MQISSACREAQTYDLMNTVRLNMCGYPSQLFLMGSKYLTEKSWHHSYICILASCVLSYQLVFPKRLYPSFFSLVTGGVLHQEALKQYR